MSRREDILVLGATSLVGRFLPPRLAERRWSAVLVSRNPAEAAAQGLRWLRADLTQTDLPERLPSVSTVLSLSPIWLLPEALPALQQAGMRRIAAFSSTSVLTKARSPVASEREVARKLAEAEAELARFCDRGGIGWTVLRPTMIYAEGRDQNVSRLAGLIRRFGVLPLAGEGRGLRQPVHAEDLARAALSVLERPETLGRTYELPGGETLTYREMVERIFQALGRKPRILSLPPSLWRLSLKLAGPLLPGATAAMGQRMAENLTFDAEPARRDFGWNPRPFRPQFGA